MAINSKRKGNRGELEIVHILNTFYHTKQFQRVPSSGAIATISKELTAGKSNILIGDIIVPDDYPYFFEVKNYTKEPDLWKILETGELLSTWEEERTKQLKQIITSNKKGIVLVFKRSHREWLCLMDNIPSLLFDYIKISNRFIFLFRDFLKSFNWGLKND